MTEPLCVVCFKWRTPGYRSTFGPAHVAALRRMVARHYPHPHRFILFSQHAEEDSRWLDEVGSKVGGLEDVEVFQLWDDLAAVQNPSGHKNPSCYRRLRIFARDVGSWLGQRIVWLDLDTVITGDLTPLWHRPEDFVIWGDTNRANPYNGSMCLFTAGARPELWEDFDPVRSPRLGASMGYFGSDQAWIAAKLGPKEARWTMVDGVYSFRNEIAPRRGQLPKNARVVFFHGRHDPDSKEAQKLEWVREHYR